MRIKSLSFVYNNERKSIMISDVLSDSLSRIEEYQSQFPGSYEDTRDEIEQVKQAMTRLLIRLDEPPEMTPEGWAEGMVRLSEIDPIRLRGLCATGCTKPGERWCPRLSALTTRSSSVCSKPSKMLRVTKNRNSPRRWRRTPTRRTPSTTRVRPGYPYAQAGMVRGRRSKLMAELSSGSRRWLPEGSIDRMALGLLAHPVAPNEVFPGD